MNQLAFIFDMDGVIVDSEPVYRSRNKDIFKSWRREVDEDTQLNFIGGTAKRKWTILTRAIFTVPYPIWRIQTLWSINFYCSNNLMKNEPFHIK